MVNRCFKSLYELPTELNNMVYDRNSIETKFSIYNFVYLKN